MENFQFTGKSCLSPGVCAAVVSWSVSSYLCLSYLPPPHTRACPSDGVGCQQGLTDQAVLQALATQDLQLRPDNSKA